MRFLVRIIFWLGVVLVFLPSGREHLQSSALMSATEAISAAKATVSDARGFCDRQPDACAIGSQAAVSVGHRAQAGAKKLYEYLQEHLAQDEAGASRGADKPPRALARPQADTLTPADRAVPWRSLRTRKEGRLERDRSSPAGLTP
jgi:hypothetical protein